MHCQQPNREITEKIVAKRIKSKADIWNVFSKTTDAGRKKEPGAYTKHFRTPQKFGAASGVRRPGITEEDRLKYERNLKKTATPKSGAFLRCSGCDYEISEQQFLSKLPDHIKIENLNDFRSIASKVTCSQCGLKGEAKVIYKQSANNQP